MDGEQSSLNERVLAVLKRVEWAQDLDGMFWCHTCDAENLFVPPAAHDAGCEIASLMSELRALLG